MASNVPSDLYPLLHRMAHEDGLFDADLAMVCGWTQVESAFNPHAVRYEPAFFRRYVEPQNLASATEARCRAMSWGLWQVMGQVARERGFSGTYLPELCEPDVNALFATRHLLWMKERTDGTWEAALAAYNGGLGGNREAPYRRQAYVDKVKQSADRFRGPGLQCEA